VTEDEKQAERISKMTEGELLDYLMGNTDIMNDSYYAVFSEAVHARYRELRGG